MLQFLQDLDFCEKTLAVDGFGPGPEEEFDSEPFVILVLCPKDEAISTSRVRVVSLLQPVRPTASGHHSDALDFPDKLIPGQCHLDLRRMSVAARNLV
jgi:hypothetical protein